MSTHKHFDVVCVFVLAAALFLTVVFMCGDVLGVERIVDEDSEAHSDQVYFTKNDMDAAYDISQAVEITLDGDDASISGNGAYAYDGGVVIANPGVYVITGSLSDGSITVDSSSRAKVWLYFDDVSVTCEDSAALIVKKADKVFLTLAEDSVNTLRSGSEYSKAATDVGIDGVIYAKDDLTIGGSGTLYVEGGIKHGIVANDDMVITGGTLFVTSSGDAIHVNDSLRIMNLTAQLTAGDDGLLVDNEGGWVYIESGSIEIVAGDEGIKAEGEVYVAEGAVNVSLTG